MKSYTFQSQRIPSIKAPEDKVAYLRGMIVSQYRVSDKGTETVRLKNVQGIEKDKEWIFAEGERDLLACALAIPIRTLTVHAEKEICGIRDIITFTEKSNLRKTGQHYTL